MRQAAGLTGGVHKPIAARRVPRPSYVVDDGTEMFPADRFRLVDDAGGVDAMSEHFAVGHEDAARRQLVPVDELDALEREFARTATAATTRTGRRRATR